MTKNIKLDKNIEYFIVTREENIYFKNKRDLYNF